MNKAYVCLVIVILTGCASLTGLGLQELFGAPDPQRHDTPTAPKAGLSYHHDIQPVFDRRCVVCHACYDAPCQLKLSAWEGVARGSNVTSVYDGTRLLEATPSRLFIDADRPSMWRTQGFNPVLNERKATPVSELEGSTLYRMLRLKTRHPLPGDAILPDSMDFSQNREQQCSKVEDFDQFERNNPLSGMPFGLPGVSEAESGLLERWLRQGAPYEGAPPLPASMVRQVEDWERFFNGDSLKEQLVNRFIYEHLFLGHLYFSNESGKPRFFRMVRSTTPPGVPAKEIATRRPYDEPGVARVYYRLVPEQESISIKSHMPYALNPERMARWRSLFLAPDYAVTRLPDYRPVSASNPFVTFQSLPVSARYRFMLDEAAFSVMGFIKGPVCRGQTALNVIDDHFWVFFLDPEYYGGANDTEFLEREKRSLEMPAAWQSNSLVISPSLEYAELEKHYLLAKSKYLEQHLDRPDKVTLNSVWNGEGRNPNAALTVYRHFDGATVLQGMQGERPKTSWILGYPLLERIHYLLVAGYDVYGNIGHQLNTRLYMDYLRMEGEYNFLINLPRASRIPLRDFWYRNVGDDVKDRVYGRIAHFDRDTGIPFRSKVPQETMNELLGMLEARLAPALAGIPKLNALDNEVLRHALQALGNLRGARLDQMPALSFLRVDEETDQAGKDAPEAARYFTLMRNTGHLNVTHLLTESRTVVPAEHSLDVLPGLVGAYPNAIYRMPRSALPEFTAAIGKLKDPAGYRALMDRFGVRRTRADFWETSDALHDAQARQSAVQAGLFDYNRLENR